jgi:hypothetical protein
VKSSVSLSTAFAVLLLSGSAPAVLAQSSSPGVLPAPDYDTFTPPPAGSAYNDPVFGTTIKRLSNAVTTPDSANGGYLTWINNEYSTASPFNSDNSRFLLVHQSYFALYDGSGAYIRDLPFEINASSEPRWSRKDNATLYYRSGNQLKSFNTSTLVTTVVRTFSEYTTISGRGTADISLDGDHMVFCGDNRNIFVYEISTGRKFQNLNSAQRGFDSFQITPRNNVLVSWLQSGTKRFNGIELYDINMRFQRQVSHSGGHMDVTVDSNGDELMVWTNSNDASPIPSCNNGIVKVRLRDGLQTCLAQLDWSLAVHISAPDGNGYVYVDTEAPVNPQPGTSGWVPYTNEILQIRLDGGGVIRWAHHRSRPFESYNWQPKLSISRDGTRLLYSSNYNLQAIEGATHPTLYTDAYLIVFK